MKHHADIERVMEQYGNSIHRMSFYILQDEQDAQDVLQETLIKYMQKAPSFEDASQEKAWLLRVAGNLCKDMLRFRKRTRHLSIEELMETNENLLSASAKELSESRELVAQIFTLPEKYKHVIYLHYYEGYSVKEVAQMLRITESTAKKRLERGRNRLRLILEEDSL